MNRQAVETIAAVIAGVVSILGLFEASGYRGASAYMPVATTGLATLLCLIWAGQSVRQMLVGQTVIFQASFSHLIKFLITASFAVAYVLGVTWVGFFTTTIVMVPALAAALGYRQWRITCIATLCFAILLYAVFRLLLSIPLPPEVIPQLLIGG